MRKSLLCAILGICLTVGVISSADTQAKTILGATKTAILVWIAVDMGYFNEVPGGIEVKGYQSGTQTARDLQDGKIHLATSSEFAFGSNVLASPDLRVVATLSTTRTCRLFARSDRGIADVADLRGKRIGLTKKSIGQYFLGQALALAGIQQSDVELVDMKPIEIAAALADGRIDAGITWEPYVYLARKDTGGVFRLLERDDSRYYYFLLISNEEWLSKHPDVAAGIVRGLKSAERFAKDEPQEAMALIQRRFELEAEYVAQLWPQHTLRVGLPQDLLFVLEEGIQWRIDENLTAVAEVPDVMTLIGFDALEAVSPRDIGIFR